MLKALPTLFIIADSQLQQNLQRGAIIIRDYDHPQREAYARGIIAQAKGPVLVAGDVELARRVKARGVHVPEWQLSRLPRRLFCPRGWIVTAACHNLKAIKKAERHGLIQAVLVSPVLATQSHPDAEPLGFIRFGLLVRQSRLPVIALGGLKRQKMAQIRGVGGYGIALRSAG